MFFIMGITQGRKDFNFNQMVICNHCGSYGRYQVYMTYMCLSLFSFPFSNGTNNIMCRCPAAILSMPWTRSSENGLPGERILRYYRNT